MNLSVILAHPTPGSFNHAITGQAVSALKELGHQIWAHDLYAEQFDPVMVSSEIPRGAAMPPLVESHAAEIEHADGLVIVHPNWWCQPPAILKGWVDRVFRPGRAYNFVPDGKGGAKSQGLLKIRQALVITTANNPQEREVEMYGDPLEVFWKQVVFANLGIANVERLIFAPVILSTLEQRQAWLSDVDASVRRLFKNQ